MAVNGVLTFGTCDCDQCKMPTAEDIKRIRDMCRGGE
jgi:hypothetical protein